MSTNRYLDDFSKVDWGEKIYLTLSFLTRPIIEIGYGIMAKAIPLHLCFMWGILAELTILTHLDRRLFKIAHIGSLYPVHPNLYWPYCFCSATMGFWLWGFRQTQLRQKLIKRLTEVFKTAGLENALGKFPSFICDQPIDNFTRKLRLTRANLSKQDFEKAKDALAGSLQVYIDEIREERETGVIEIIYSQIPLPEFTTIENIHEVGAANFIVGRTRARQLIASLRNVPHLLVAGLTGGGKSTFLRALIVTLFLNNKDYEFTLIDLKGGLEFQIFENIERIKVIPSIDKAIAALENLQQTLNLRMTTLKEFGCKDIDAFARIANEPRYKNSKIPRLNRHIVVVDEIAELFLSGAGVDSRKIQKARRILSQIARQGRSVGIHLVAATQRPDSRALDPQVKANLPGVLCFQMLNDASSITVLGNGRATDLPAIPGRAIWKSGAEMQEVQVPYLGPDITDELLEKFKTKLDSEEQGHDEAKLEPSNIESVITDA